jgi:PAS domain S-box-containing protein
MDIIFKLKEKIKKNNPDRESLILITKYLALGFFWLIIFKGFCKLILPEEHPFTIFYILSELIFIIISAIFIYLLLKKKLLNKYKFNQEIINDIEEIEQQEEKNSRFNLIEDMVDIGIWEYDLREKKLYLSYWAQNKLNKHYNYINKDPIEMIIDFIHPEDKEQARHKWQDYLTGKTEKYYNTFRIYNNSKYIYLKHSGRFVNDKSGNKTKVIGITNEITREKELENELYHLAYYDDLTALPNEKYFQDKLEKLIKKTDQKENSCFAVFYLEISDLDNISNIVCSSHANYTARIIAAELKYYSDLKLLGYYYGDKFLLLYQGINSKEEIAEKANKILAILKNLWEKDKIEYYLNCKIGISLYPLNGGDARTLITRAHHAMHTIEDANTFFHVYNQEMYYKKLNNVRLKNDLRKAVENKELYLVYQPKLDLKQKKIVALEALTRWKHPQIGSISPEFFIPIAENSNLINKIDKWVIKQVISELNRNDILKKYQKTISINLSPYDLKDNSLPIFLEELIEKEKINTNQIDFEITESVLLDSLSNELDNLNKLKELGFLISLDDFGKGYSSLSYLTKLPLDILKIDKSFIKNINFGSNKILIEKIIELSHQLNLKVVAEGVENKKEVEILQELNCDFVQGYYYYRPMPLEEIARIIDRN